MFPQVVVKHSNRELELIPGSQLINDRKRPRICPRTTRCERDKDFALLELVSHGHLAPVYDIRQRKRKNKNEK